MDKTTLSSCFRGSLTFQLRYDFIHRVLMLHVKRANSLPTIDSIPDSYVKMYCLPERRNHWKTSIIKKNENPEFNEMFSFDILYSDVPNRMLQVSCFKSCKNDKNFLQIKLFSLLFMILTVLQDMV